MAASSYQYTTDRPTVALASTSEDIITNILQLDSITQLSSQIEMLNKNFANIGLVAAANPSETSHRAKSSEEQGSIEEQMQYIEPPDHEEEAVNYVNPQWGDNNNPRKLYVKISEEEKDEKVYIRKRFEAEPESKKSSAPRDIKELDIPDTELPRPELVSTSGKSNVVVTKAKDKDVP
ncbi:hypothetical protein Dimus_000787, partial [Dionaea muscipula]